MFFDRVKNIMGKGENAVYQYFFLFPHVFKRLLSQFFVAFVTMSSIPYFENDISYFVQN